MTRYLISALLAAAWAWGAANQHIPADAGDPRTFAQQYDCETDSECEAACLETLQPDEDHTVCDVEA